MSIWFFLWLFLSGALLYFLGWTIFILFRQKQAWTAFAVEKGLRYRTASMMASPEMSGTVDGRAVSFLIGEHISPDGRSSRKLSAIEVQLLNRMPFEGGIGNGNMVPLIHSMRLKEEINPNYPKWDKNYIATASSGYALEAYLTPERLEALTSMMKIRNGSTILIFRGDMMLLRFDTPDPLDNKQKLSKILAKMTETARVLELKAGEDSRLKADAARTPVRAVNLQADERDFSESAGFALEDDQSPEKEKP
ncbi:MAG: hypothetical protein WBK55_01355 [Alphaproteobacteria bacterium]